MNNQVVAYSPNELVAAQVTVRGWCAENIRRLLMQKHEAEQNIQVALDGRFNSKPFKAILRRCERRIDYYKKIGKAIKLGYMIVPNFDLDLFAVRTSKKKPRKEVLTYDNFQQTGEILPEGDGRYVDVEPYTEHEMRDSTNYKNEPCRKKFYWPTAFDEEITFPATIIKPHIIKETQKAMGFKLFDQIGVARGRRISCGDPIVCGRFLDRTRSEKAVTFFIAWWLDQDDI